MKRFLFVLLLALAWSAMHVDVAPGQCPGGCCGESCYAAPQPMQVLPDDGWQASRSTARTKTSTVDRPTRAWRYESVTRRKCYQSVVRVQTVDRDGRRSFGSGVAVRWGRQIVILTASHVVKDARRIWVLTKRKKYQEARCVRWDSTWDVAVLTVGSGTDFEPASIAWRAGGHPGKGDRLESAGYGPDGRLAVNSGLFLGYRAPFGERRAADWLALSGYARGGDSGGPVFNDRGEVVAVLWGTTDRKEKEVVGAQCGRLHALLTAALGPWDGSTKPEARNTCASCVPRSERMTPIKFPAQSGFLGSGQSLLNPERPALLPVCGRPGRRAQPPAPAPQAPEVIVQSDPSISPKLDQLIANTTPPVEPEKPKAEPNVGMLIALGLGGILLGFIAYFGAKN